MQPSEAIVTGFLLYTLGAFLLFASAWLHMCLTKGRSRTWLGAIIFTLGGMLHVGGAMLGMTSVFLTGATRDEFGKTDLVLFLMTCLLAAVFAVSSSRHLISLLRRWLMKRSPGAEETWGRRYFDLIIAREKNL